MKNLKKMFGEQIPNPTAVCIKMGSRSVYYGRGRTLIQKMNGKMSDHDTIGKPLATSILLVLIPQVKKLRQ